MSKRVIVEWDYIYFDNLKYLFDRITCYSFIQSYVVLGQSVDWTSWIDCNEPSPIIYDYMFGTTGLPPICFIPASSPLEIIIATGNCYEEYMIPEYSIYMRWVVEFLDINGVYVKWRFGAVDLPLSPLSTRDCIKYILNPFNVTIGNMNFIILNPDLFIPCDDGCECCCNCC